MSHRTRLGLLAAAALLLGACEDVDRWEIPTPVAAWVVVASSERVERNDHSGPDAPAPEAVPTAVAGLAVRREPTGDAGPPVAPPAVTIVAGAPPPARTPLPTAPPRRTPALSRAAAATATVRAGLRRVIRPGTADEARLAGGAARAALGAGGAAAASAGTVDGAELLRRLNGLSPTDPRCNQLAVIAQGAAAPRETAPFPLTRSPEAELLLERLRVGCGLEGVQLTPELTAAIAVLSLPAPGAVARGAAGADLGTLTDRGRLEAERRLLERERARPVGGAAQPPAAAPAPAAPRPPAAGDRGFTAPATAGRPPAYDGVRAATGIR